MQSHTKGYLIVLIECLIGAAIPLFSKILTVSVPFLIWGRAFVGLIAITLILILTKRSPRLHRRSHYAIMALGGVIMAVHWLTSFWGYRLSTVGMGIMALFSYPLITTLLEPLVTKKKGQPIDLVLSVIGLGGIVLIVPDYSFESHMTWGVILCVISALLFVIRTFIMKHYIHVYRSRVLMFYQLLFVTLSLTPVWLFSSFDAPSSEIPWLIIMGVFFTLLPHSLLVKGLQYLSPTTMGILKYIAPVITLVYAYIFIGEVPTLRVILGGIVILGAGVSKMAHELYTTR